MSSLRGMFSDLLRVGLDVLSSVQDSTTNAVLANLGDASSGYRDTDQADVWNATQGVMCMPATATAGQPSCQALVVSGGNRDSIIALRDVRTLSNIGTLQPGDSAFFATGNSFARIYCRQNGQVQITTNEGNASGGASTTITVGTDGSVTIDAPTEVKVGPNAALVAIAGGATPLVPTPWAAGTATALESFATPLSTINTVPGIIDYTLAGSLAALGVSLLTALAALPSDATTKTTAT